MGLAGLLAEGFMMPVSLVDWLDLKQHYLANKTFTDKEHLMTTINHQIARFNRDRQAAASPSFDQAA